MNGHKPHRASVVIGKRLTASQILLDSCRRRRHRFTTTAPGDCFPCTDVRPGCCAVRRGEPDQKKIRHRRRERSGSAAPTLDWPLPLASSVQLQTERQLLDRLSHCSTVAGDERPPTALQAVRVCIPCVSVRPADNIIDV